MSPPGVLLADTDDPPTHPHLFPQVSYVLDTEDIMCRRRKGRGSEATTSAQRKRSVVFNAWLREVNDKLISCGIDPADIDPALAAECAAATAAGILIPLSAEQRQVLADMAAAAAAAQLKG